MSTACRMADDTNTTPQEIVQTPPPNMSGRMENCDGGEIRYQVRSKKRSQNKSAFWIENVFKKRECSKFIPIDRNYQRCCCGRGRSGHTFDVQQTTQTEVAEEWKITKHTKSSPTDAFGTIDFQGGPHPHKAQYVRLAYDDDPGQILKLFANVWGIEPPKLVITVHGGIANFSLQPKLAREFKKGLLKAAKTTGAWIITSGINSGVVRHVAAAIGSGAGNRSRSKIVTIGIAPWGLLKKQNGFIGRDTSVTYHAQSLSPKGRLAVLDDKHSFFLFVDNGTHGRYGADIILRKRFEEYLSMQTIEAAHKHTRRKPVPIVCVVLEGGICTIRSVLDYVTNTPPVPVVVCDGSGRAADLLAFVHQSEQDSGVFPQLSNLVQSVFGYDKHQAAKAINELELCVRKRHLITVFRLGEDLQQDFDNAILTAFLKGLGLKANDQLSLALAWNRVDIARSDIFVLGQEWPVGYLESAMMEALLSDKVDFVKLLLENGVLMTSFLTMERLEELYNNPKGPPSTLAYIMSSVVNIGNKNFYTLPDIGLAIEELVGSPYISSYIDNGFMQKYLRKKQVLQLKQKSLSSMHSHGHYSTKSSSEILNAASEYPLGQVDPDFEYPFNELLVWAVLMKRQEMARLMWHHGEDALPKSLVASKLYKRLAKEAANDYLEAEICDKLHAYSEEFRKLAVELLQHCYETNDDMTFPLLTYELKHWGNQTSLSLAVLANHKEFLAHPSCQILLADLWHGGLQMSRNSNFKVLAGLLFPPYIVWLDYKTKEELLLQPQTAEEHKSSGKAMESIFAEELELHDDSETEQATGSNADVENGNSNGQITNSIDLFNRTTNEENVLKNSVRSNDHRKQAEVKTSVKFSSSELGGVQYRKHSVLELVHNKQSPVRSISAMSRERSSSRRFRQPKKRNLPYQKKLYEFCTAPITKFWLFSLSYIVFLSAYTYTVLIRTPDIPEWSEIYVTVTVLSIGVEMVRKMLMSEPKLFKQKIKVFCKSHWNWTTVLAVLMFVLGAVLRESHDTDVRMTGRVLLCCNICFWYLKLLEILAVNNQMGPYITMFGKMILQMFCIIVILNIVLMAFGVLRQSILFPNQEFEWLLVRNIFYKPYFMLYGEVYAGEIDTCGDEAVNCVPGAWITVAAMSAFLLIAILLISLLIAVFNNVFTDVSAVAQQVWKFQRYHQVMEYEAMPFLPPPLNMISVLWLLLKYIFKSRKKGSNRRAFDYSLKLFLEEEDVERIHDFEEECMDDLAKQKEYIISVSLEERQKNTADRCEFILMKMNDMASKDALNKSRLAMLEERLENNQLKISKDMNLLLQLQKLHSSRASLSHGSDDSSQSSDAISPLRNRKSNLVDNAVPTNHLKTADLKEKRNSAPFLLAESVGHSKDLLSKTHQQMNKECRFNPHTLVQRTHSSPAHIESITSETIEDNNLLTDETLSDQNLSGSPPKFSLFTRPTRVLMSRSVSVFPRVNNNYTSITDGITSKLSTITEATMEDHVPPIDKTFFDGSDFVVPLIRTPLSRMQSVNVPEDDTEHQIDQNFIEKQNPLLRHLSLVLPQPDFIAHIDNLRKAKHCSSESSDDTDDETCCQRNSANTTETFMEQHESTC